MKTGASPGNRSRGAARHVLLGVALGAGLLWAPWPVPDAAAEPADVIKVELENIYWSYDEGGRTIYSGATGCGDTLTSGGKVVFNMDYPGDWVEVNFTLAGPVTFFSTLHTAGAEGLRRKYAVQFRALQGQQPDPVPDTLLTPPGKGIT